MISCVEAKTKAQKKTFERFRHALYRGDPFYVSTVEFNLKMLLYKTTTFAKNAWSLPLLVYDEQVLVAECILVHDSHTDFLQMAYFEALPNAQGAVESLKDYAKDMARRLGLGRVIVGLCGHLSYGVGLSLDMTAPNTFDSTYTKTYYPAFFEDGEIHTMRAYRSESHILQDKFASRTPRISVRPIEMRKFREEMALFRELTEQTIGKTFLYAQTEPHHFEEIIGEMSFFLKAENILFAFDGERPVGFLFWHPDYCEVLPKGKQNSLLAIAIRYIAKQKQIKTVKVNAIGAISGYAGRVTEALLHEMSRYTAHYTYVETNFVWDENRPSRLLNDSLFAEPFRRFAVWEYRI